MLVKLLHDRALMPTRNHPSDMGVDIYAVDDVILRPGEVLKIPTGIAIAGGGLAFGKSGRGAAGIDILAGVIDEQYTGEVFIVAVNVNIWPALHGDFTPIVVERGKAICQLLVEGEIEIVQSLPNGERGMKGFGSSD